MPRRKKKERNSSELPRLQFVESPSTNQSPPRLSPDFGAINPITARAVAIDDLQDLSWVTPQFGERCHYRQCENLNARRSTRLRRTRSSDSRNYDPKSNVLSKYRPLSFVTNCDRVKTRPQGVVHSRQNTGQILTSHNLNVNNNDCIDEEHQPSPSDNHTHRDSFLESFQISTPVILDENDSSGGNSDSPRIRKILDPHHRQGRNKGQCEEYKPSNTSLHCDADKIQRSSDSGSRKKGLSSVFDKSGSRTKQCLLDFINSSSSSLPPSPEVLVADTPECDYDLTLRQRQIKYLLRSRSR